MSSLKKNIAYQTCYEILIFILPLFTSPYIARVLGAEQIGVYSFTYSIAYYFQLFGMLGIKYHGTRTIAAVRDDQEQLNHQFNSILVLHVIVSMIATVAYLITCLFIKSEMRTIYLLQTFFVLSAVFDINWFFNGMENFKITVTRNSLFKVLTVICVFVFVKEKSDLWKYTLIMACGMSLSQSIVWIKIREYIKFEWPTFKNVISHLKPMLILFLPILSVSIFKYMDKIMLGILSTKIEVGLYENAEKVIDIPSSLIIAFGTVMLPKMTNLNANGAEDVKNNYISLSFKYLMWVSLGMAFGIFAVADIFAINFWGEEFARCGTLLRILAISIPFTTYANIVRTQYLMPEGHDKIYLEAMISGVVINFSLNIILVRTMQSTGVALATLFTEIFVMIYQMIRTNKLQHKKYIVSFTPFLIPSGIMVLVVSLINNRYSTSIIILLLEISIGAVVYIFISMIIMIKNKDFTIKNVIRIIRKGEKK